MNVMSLIKCPSFQWSSDTLWYLCFLFYLAFNIGISLGYWFCRYWYRLSKAIVSFDIGDEQFKLFTWMDPLKIPLEEWVIIDTLNDLLSLVVPHKSFLNSSFYIWVMDPISCSHPSPIYKSLSLENLCEEQSVQVSHLMYR